MPETILVLAASTDFGWVDAASRLGVVGFLVASLYGLGKRWWVPGWVYRESIAREDEWKTIARMNAEAAERAVRVGESVTEKLPA